MQKYITALLMLTGQADVFSQSTLLNLDENGVIISGYDPVAYFTDLRPVQGVSAYQTKYEGAVYFFASEEHKRQFDSTPGKYAVSFGGFCAYAVSQGHVSPIDPNYCTVQKDADGIERLLCQHNQKAAELWNKNPGGLLIDAYRYWPAVVRNGGKQISVKGLEQFFVNLDGAGLANQGFDVVAYHSRNMALPGDPKFTEWFHGGKYLFSTKENQEMFRLEPRKYLPQYGGFCAYAMSLGKIRPVNPQIFSIENGRLFLQHTQEAYDEFYRDVESNIGKADHQWTIIEHKKAGQKIKFDKPAK